MAETARRVVDRHDPDVLLLRFNQTDHVQEFLGWQQRRGAAAESRDAEAQILQTYAEVSTHIASLVSDVGPDTQVVLFSDHGIDWVETHLRPNAVLDQLGLAARMVFQGDSTCAYLYADEPLTCTERLDLIAALHDLGPGVKVLGQGELGALGLPTCSDRTGRLVLGCGRHTEFIYSGSPVRENVRSASHGFDPRVPEMTGFFRAFGAARLPSDLPTSVTEVASLVRVACRTVLKVRA
ncbi:MAG: alkaline phosphatase family protein [Propioniciclava sp.]